MMWIVLMLLLLAGSFALFRGLVGFCENLIGPAPGIGPASRQIDGPATRARKIVKRFLSASSG
jgi:hypothetical protein